MEAARDIGRAEMEDSDVVALEHRRRHQQREQHPQVAPLAKHQWRRRRRVFIKRSLRFSECRHLPSTMTAWRQRPLHLPGLLSLVQILGLTAEFFEERLGVLQIGGVEAFGEPAVDYREHRARLVAPAVLDVKARETDGRAKLPRFRTMLPRMLDCSAETLLGLGSFGSILH